MNPTIGPARVIQYTPLKTMEPEHVHSEKKKHHLHTSGGLCMSVFHEQEKCMSFMISMETVAGCKNFHPGNEQGAPPCLGCDMISRVLKSIEADWDPKKFRNEALTPLRASHTNHLKRSVKSSNLYHLLNLKCKTTWILKLPNMSRKTHHLGSYIGCVLAKVMRTVANYPSFLLWAIVMQQAVPHTLFVEGYCWGEYDDSLFLFFICTPLQIVVRRALDLSKTCKLFFARCWICRVQASNQEWFTTIC